MNRYGVSIQRPRPHLIVTLLVVVIALSSAANASQERPLVRTRQSGNWSSPETWEKGAVPQAGDSVLVRTGHHVLYDIDSQDIYRAIYLAGTLEFTRDRSTRLETGLIVIQAGEHTHENGFDCHHPPSPPQLGEERPALIVGTANAPLPAEHEARIRLHYLAGMDPQTCPAIVCCGGRMDFHGAPLVRSWVKLDQTARLGDQKIEVQGDLSGWRANDRLILTGTHHPEGEPLVPTLAERSQTEERHLVSLRPTGSDRWTVKLDEPVHFEHFAEGEFRGEVANLTRNVVIESADPEGIRGHTMYHRHSTGSISYAEFRHLGKQGVLGKYAIHFHLCGDTMRGSSVIGASIWDSHNRWLTIHGTDFLVVQDCVGYQSIGHGFFLEDGTESFNVLDRNLAVLVLPGKPLPEQVLPFDQNKGAGFWWANCHNTFTRNVAAECSEYGYQFESRQTVDFDPNCSVLQCDGTRKQQDIRTLPFIRFENNEGHSLPFFGINLRGLNRPESGIIQFAEANKDLAQEAMAAVPDGSYPFHVRNSKFWDTRWPVHAGTTGVFLDGLQVYRSTYGIWRTVADRHTYRNLSFREIGHRDLHMPLSIGLPDEAQNTGPGQGAYYAGIGGFWDDQPPSSVITGVRRDEDRLVMHGMSSDSSPVQRVMVNGHRAYSLRDDFAEWEATLPAPAPGKAISVSAVAEDDRGQIEQNPHHLEYISPDAGH